MNWLERQQFAINASARLRAGRDRSAGNESGSLWGIVAKKANGVFWNNIPNNGSWEKSNAQWIDSSSVSNAQNSLNITPEQISAILNEIGQKLPFGPALVPVLTALRFTDVSKNENDGKLTLWVNEYEIFKTKVQEWPNKEKEISVIRMPNHTLKWENTDIASKVINAIKQLFPEQNIQFTLNGLNAMADQHGIFPGYRDADDAESEFVDDAVYAWVEGAGDAASAHCAFRNRRGGSNSGIVDRRSGSCLVASVG